MFGKDMAILTFYIKPDKTADFEKVITRLHQALANSDKPERKQQAAGWKVFKGSEPGPSGTVVYVNLISPVLKGADYSIAKIINEVYPAEAQVLFPAYKEAIAGLSRSELDIVADLSGPAPPAAPRQRRRQRLPSKETRYRSGSVQSTSGRAQSLALPTAPPWARPAIWTERG